MAGSKVIRHNHPGSLRFPRMLLAVLLFTAVFCLGPRPVEAGDSWSDHLRWAAGSSHFGYIPGGGGTFGQGSYDLARAGSWLLVPDAHWGLYCYEVVAPGEIVRRSFVDGGALRVAAEGSFAYVAGESGLRVVTITAAGQLFSRGELGGLDLNDVAIQGDVAYTASWTGMRAISVADPDAPVVVGSLPNDCVRIAVRGEYAYLSRTSGLWVADISDPSQPELLSQAFSAGTLYDIVLEGNYLYVTQSAYGLRVFDVTDPERPALVSSVPFTGAVGIAFGEGRLVVGNELKSIHVDVSDPAAPIAGGVSRSVGCLGGSISDGFAYLGSFEEGVQVMELREGTAPTPITSLPEFAAGSSFVRFGDSLALLVPGGLEILDVSMPEAPSSVGSLALTSPRSMCGQGDYVYIAEGGASDGLHVVDVSNPSAPTEVGFLPEVEGDVCIVEGDRVYVSAYSRIYIVDVADPSSPSLLATDHQFTSSVETLAADGYVVYIGGNFEYTGFVFKYDYTVPTAPVTLAQNTTSIVADLLYRDGFLYSTGPFELTSWDADLNWIDTLGHHEFGGAWSRAGIASGPTGRIAAMNFWGGFHLFEDDGSLLYLGSATGSADGSYGISDLGTHIYFADNAALHVFAAPSDPAGFEAPPRDPTDLTRGRLRAEPNPTTGRVRFSWMSTGPHADADDRGRGVVLEIFDVSGRLLRTLHSPEAAGAEPLVWDGRDAGGSTVPPGVVYTRLQTPHGSATGAVRIVR